MSVIVQNGKILIYPTRIIIDGYYERNSKIENSFSVWDKVIHNYSFQAFVKDEKNNRLIIPSGYPIKWLIQSYPNYEIEDRRLIFKEYFENKKRENKNCINMKFDCRDNIQKEAVKFLNDNSTMQKYLCLKTGQGKTFCAVKYVADNNERPIIFIDQDSLGKQWEQRILEYTDTLESEIYFISGKKSIDTLMKMTPEEINSIKFFICCHRTLTINIKNNKSSKEIADLFNKLNLTVKIFDEAHVEYMSIFKIDMITNLKAIYLSATPERSDPTENKVYQNMFLTVKKFFPNVVNKDLQKDENKEYHNIIIYKWNSNPSAKNQFDCATKYGFSMAKYCNYLLEDKTYKKFEEFIYSILFDFVLNNRRKKKIAILFGTNALIDKFYNNIINYIEKNKYKLKVGKFNGTIKKEERIEILENSDIILTTDKSFSKGMDVKNLQILINTVPFSSSTKLTQVVGRLRRIPNKEVSFLDLNDIGFQAIKFQLNTKIDKVYSKLAKNLYIKEY